MQVSIARQLGLQPTTVGNFFMNARRRLHDKWQISEHENHSIASSTASAASIGAKLENNNDHSSNMACIMVDHYPNSITTGATACHSASMAASQTSNNAANNVSAAADPHADLVEGFSLDSFEPVTSEAAAASCVYSLTSL